MKFAIIGCGLIGNKRATALPEGLLAVACDADISRAEALTKRFSGCVATNDSLTAVLRKDVDAVLICTPNHLLAPIALEALKHGKHILVEKPAGIRLEEVEELSLTAQAANLKVRVGFNHRYHPAFLKAREIFDSGILGPLMHIRARYGHGGRTGYDREWRANPALSGGGELIDQGVHLIDLSRWFLGEFDSVEGHVTTSFWDMEVDDNAFLSLRTAAGQTAWLHASCTEWKNLFSFEIFGRDGKLQIDGLGGSYGTERLTFYKMLPQMGPPETTSWEYPRGDESWACEIREFLRDIAEDRIPSPNLNDAAKALEIVRTICRKSQKPAP
jgi:predicted dehydrogenase